MNEEELIHIIRHAIFNIGAYIQVDRYPDDSIAYVESDDIKKWLEKFYPHLLQPTKD